MSVVDRIKQILRDDRLVRWTYIYFPIMMLVYALFVYSPFCAAIQSIF